jgi:hypothetical protein
MMTDGKEVPLQKALEGFSPKEWGRRQSLPVEV